MDVLEYIKRLSQKLNSTNNSCHKFDHTLRVYKMCQHIGKKEKADLETLSIVAYLHDIGRANQDNYNGKICHAKSGAEKAKKIIEPYNLEKYKKENIIHCIKTHRFREGNKPQTLEAKILSDADKLDAIGAVGIGRAFFFANEVGAYLHNKDINIKKTKPYTKNDTAYREFLVKLQFIKDKMFTQEGKKIAQKRHKFMVDFFKRINKEVDGIL